MISDNGNKRVQLLATLYKPEAPQQLAAQGKVHSIELSWAQADRALYQAISHLPLQERERQLHADRHKPNNQFADQDLDADVRYYYRIGGETYFGFEGATSAVVSGVPTKFVPPAIAAVQVETTPWQVKMNWTAADAKYFSAYRIYQKDGETFTKIGEVTQPEFIRDALTPETKYTYYVSTFSSDGTESEKVAVEATTQIFNRPPLEIEVVQLRDVFSNSYKMYERDGIGRIKLTNNTNKTMERLKVTFQLRDFMDFPTETKLDKLLPGQSEEVALKAVFNNSILTLTEDSSVQAMIEASYFENGKRVTYSKNPTVNVYDKHRLTWDERDRYADFHHAQGCAGDEFCAFGGDAVQGNQGRDTVGRRRVRRVGRVRHDLHSGSEQSLSGQLRARRIPSITSSSRARRWSASPAIAMIWWRSIRRHWRAWGSIRACWKCRDICS